MSGLPKRLIEVDLPIGRISTNARAEKDSRLGHIPRLHIYPAARPATACRAVVCAALWPDPADPNCPQSFRDLAAQIITEFAREVVRNSELGKSCAPETFAKWVSLAKGESCLDATNESHLNLLRFALLDFIGDFSNWNNSTVHEYLQASRNLTQAAHEALGGVAGSRPLVLDPFAGGGAIPLESLRVGADVYAQDLNPLSIILNKILLEYLPRFGSDLIAAVGRWDGWIENRAKERLRNLYPSDGDITVAYLWARTVILSPPGEPSPIEVPVLRSMALTRGRRGGDWGIRWARDANGKIRCDTVIRKIEGESEHEVRRPLVEVYRLSTGEKFESGTVRRVSVTCPVTGHTIPVTEVRRQLSGRHGGTRDARLYCVVCDSEKDGRYFRIPTTGDFEGAAKAAHFFMRNQESPEAQGRLPILEPLPPDGTNGFRVQKYGMSVWGDLFTDRQAVALSVYSQLAKEFVAAEFPSDSELGLAVHLILALIIDRLADLNASLCGWQLNTPNSAHVFTRWALPMLFDFAEVNPLSRAGGSPSSAIRRMAACIRELDASFITTGLVTQGTAWNVGLPDDSVSAVVTDPPYYDAIPYSDLLDFFAVWLNRTLPSRFLDLFRDGLNPKDDECVVDASKGKDQAYFREAMTKSLREARRVTGPNGIAVVVFAHKSTSGWEAQLDSLISAGWTVSASWPIDTEMASRMRAMGSAALASSIHLVCRPREHSNSAQLMEVGDWRDVLQELPRRIHEWMPRLAQEGVVGADAIFACLGPALEVFSCYERVEKANGDVVTLKEYLEQVWAAVSKEALHLVFAGADASGFEEDARLTAMWLWTLSAPRNGKTESADDEVEDDEESETSSKAPKGYILEFDAARKIAQGLGARLEALSSLVEVKGETARLLPVGERTRKLFGKEESESPATSRRKKSSQLQLGFVAELEEAEEAGSWGTKSIPALGTTVLDRVHQSMILFAAGRSEALRRFLVDEGVGRDERFWRLAQVLSYLYPPASEEKRWVDGVLARKKGLGFG